MTEGVRFAVGPDGLTGFRVDGDDVTTVTGHGKEFAIHIAGSGAATAGVEAGTIPDPGGLQLGEVVSVDLCCGGIAGVSVITAQGYPFYGFLLS